MLRIAAHSFGIAVEAISRNKLRSLLTSLGIIFGVASVITMLAIGKGAEKQIIEELRILGTNNIVIESVVKEEEETVSAEEDEEKTQKNSFSPGLNLKDADGIRGVLPYVRFISPETGMPAELMQNGIRKNVNLVGVTADFSEVSGLEISRGNFFSSIQFENAHQVCVIGNSLAARFFPGKDPIGQNLKCGKNWLTVVGVTEEKALTADQIKSLDIRDYNQDVYIPLKTFLLRYRDRSREAMKSLDPWEDEKPKNFNYHQLDRIVVHTEDSKFLPELAAFLSRYFSRRHNAVEDFKIQVPQLLLKQKEKTQDLFSNVLVAIACISLLVGGIGIMNIMLASVMERTREIGIRQAVGATRNDIVLQFLSEAVTICISGGIIGILVGFILSFIIEKSTDIPTEVSLAGVLVSFLVSVSVGLLFGYYPAKKAASQDPVVSLRYE